MRKLAHRPLWRNTRKIQGFLGDLSHWTECLPLHMGQSASTRSDCGVGVLTIDPVRHMQANVAMQNKAGAKMNRAKRATPPSSAYSLMSVPRAVVSSRVINVTLMTASRSKFHSLKPRAMRHMQSMIDMASNSGA